MAQLGVIDIPATEAIGDLTVKIRITGLRRLKIRLWLAARIIRLASKIAPLTVDIAVET